MTKHACTDGLAALWPTAVVCQGYHRGSLPGLLLLQKSYPGQLLWQFARTILLWKAFHGLLLGTGTLFYIFGLKFYSRIPLPCTFNHPKVPYSQKFSKAVSA